MARVSKIGLQDHRPIQDGIVDGHLELAVGRLFHLGLAVQIVADEHDPQFPGLFVEQLPVAVSAQIPVEDEDIQIGVHLFEFDGVFHRMGAAQAAAVGALGFPGADALDKDRLLGLHDLGVFGGDELVQFQGGVDIGVLAVEVLFGFQAVTARST